MLQSGIIKHIAGIQRYHPENGRRSSVSVSGYNYSREPVLPPSFINRDGQIYKGLSLRSGSGLEVEHWVELQVAQAAIHLPQPLYTFIDQITAKHVARLYLEIGCSLVVGDQGRACYRQPPQPVQRSLAHRDDKSYREGSSLFRLGLRINVFDHSFSVVGCQVTIVCQELLHSRKICR